MPRRPRRDVQFDSPEDARIIGRSAPIRALLRRIERVAPTEATVLILGERGTGKELVAKAIQRASRRSDRPFVVVNCAALPSELLASELFGHERGAFTGAVERRQGLLAEADGGTLFLDEVGDLSALAQAMMLRFLEEGEVRPLGSSRTSRVDVRVIAATNVAATDKDFPRVIERGEFRADLYDRLSEIVLEVPPLRDRAEDIPLLVDHFLEMQSRRNGPPVPAIGPALLRRLCVQPWPGNVRALEKAIGRAVILGEEALELSEIGAASHAPAGASGAPPGDSSENGDAGAPLKPRHLTPRQQEILHLATQRGRVRRADVMARFCVSRETARRELVDLVLAGLLRRAGVGRGSRYELR